MTSKILIIGGYGAFGGRLVQLLSDVKNLNIIVAGRSKEKAEAYASTIPSEANLIPLSMDRNNISDVIEIYKPDLIVDASGPFQAYGNNPYNIVKSSISAGVPYIDIADSADFVHNISQFDELAKTKGIFVLSGASTFPLLSSAVLHELSKDMTLSKVSMGVAPSPFAGIGLNVIRAILKYTGKPITTRRKGSEHIIHGLCESRRETISPPGIVPLPNIRFSFVEVPDLKLIFNNHPSVQDIWIGAGTRPEYLLRLLNFMAAIRKVFRLPEFSRLAPFAHFAMNKLRYGEHRGGMYVSANGSLNGEEITKSWHMIAEGDDGPFVPVIAAEAIIRNFINGKKPTVGARPATDDICLAEYEKLFQRHQIKTGIRTFPQEGSLYQKVLEDAYRKLPEQVQRLHNNTDKSVWRGTANIKRGNNIISRLISKFVGFPEAGKNIPVVVNFSTNYGTEKWHRTFGDKSFYSYQFMGTGRNTNLICEKFGPLIFAMAVVVKDSKLHLIQRRWTFLGMPMPKFLLPEGDVYEHVVDGNFAFNVEVRLPIIGLLVHYKGTLRPE